MGVFIRLIILASPLLLAILMLSCGSDSKAAIAPATSQDGTGTLGDQTSTLLSGSAQPGIHESSGFFPVELAMAQLRFIIVGEMGGPVLYSSSTLPAWLSGRNAFLLGPDGRLASVALAHSSHLYLPPDLAAFTGYFSALEQKKSGQDTAVLHLPASVCVTGPTRALFIQHDKKLFGFTDGTFTFLRQFDTEISGAVTIAASPFVIILFDSYGRIVALDGQDANTLWESSGGPVLLSGGLAIHVGEDSYLHLREALDGRVLASSDLAGFSINTKPARDATRIYAVLVDGHLVAMDNDGKTLWIAETGMQLLSILTDLNQVHAVSRDMIAVFDKTTGSELWRLPLHIPPGGDPVILQGAIVYAGTDGKVYASVPDPEPVPPRAADPGERVAAVIGFRLEKYVRNPTSHLVTFMPYVDGAVHEGPSAFTVFSYGPVELGGEYWLTWDGEDRDVVLALFNEQGDELRANLDEFGTHDTFSYRLDENGRYFIALGRQDPMPLHEPLFLSVIPARRN